MGYQESFVYSKSGNNDNIEKAINIIRKYKYQQMDVLSIAKVNLLRDFSNGHKKQFPVINWTANTKLLMASGERYYQYSINRLFFVDISNRYNIPKRDDEDESLINYTNEEYAILDDLEIVSIDEYIDPKLKEPFDSYFEELEFIKNPDKNVTEIWIPMCDNLNGKIMSGDVYYDLYGNTGYIQCCSLKDATFKSIISKIKNDGFTITDNCIFKVNQNWSGYKDYTISDLTKK